MKLFICRGKCLNPGVFGGSIVYSEFHIRDCTFPQGEIFSLLFLLMFLRLLGTVANLELMIFLEPNKNMICRDTSSYTYMFLTLWHTWSQNEYFIFFRVYHSFFFFLIILFLYNSLSSPPSILPPKLMFITKNNYLYFPICWHKQITSIEPLRLITNYIGFNLLLFSSNKTSLKFLQYSVFFLHHNISKHSILIEIHHFFQFFIIKSNAKIINIVHTLILHCFYFNADEFLCFSWFPLWVWLIS